MTEIIDVHQITGEIVLSERIVSTEFSVVAIHEFIQQKSVRVEVEMGPFTTQELPNGQIEKRGISQRSLVVWEGTEYDEIINTWDNDALVTKIAQILSEQAAAQVAAAQEAQ